MNPRQTEAFRKQMVVFIELCFAPQTGISARDLSQITGVGYHMVWEYIRRWRNAGKVESIVTVTIEGQRHRVVRK